MEALGKFFVGMLVGAVAVLSRACAAVILWRWFVVSTFHLPPLTWTVAYGLVLTISVLSPSEAVEHEDKSYTASMDRMFVAGILIPWFAVGIGWSIK